MERPTAAEHHNHHPRTHNNHTANTYRLRVTNLPGRFAREAPGSASLLDHLIWEHLYTQVEDALAHYKWLKVDASRAFAFIEVDDEYEGTTIINHMHRP